MCGPSGSLAGETLKAWRKSVGGFSFRRGKRRGRRRRKDGNIPSTVDEGRLGVELNTDKVVLEVWEVGEGLRLPLVFQ